MAEPLSPDGAGDPVGAPFDPAALEAALPFYHEMMDWGSETGVPRPAKLFELGVGATGDLTVVAPGWQWRMLQAFSHGQNSRLVAAIGGLTSGDRCTGQIGESLKRRASLVFQAVINRRAKCG